MHPQTRSAEERRRSPQPGLTPSCAYVRLSALGCCLLAFAATLPPVPAAAQITEIIDSSGDGVRPLASPSCVAADSAGNVFVTSLGSGNVFKITPSGVISVIIDSSGDGTSALVLPIAVATDPSGNAFVTGLGSDNAFKISPGGAVSQVIDSSGDGSSPLLGPTGVATDSVGNVFVAGGDSYNVFKIAPDGSISRIIDSSGDGSSAFEVPQAVTTDSSGNVFVVALESNNAFKITPGGEISEIIDSAGDGTRPLEAPFFLAADSAGNVFVTGSRSNNAFKVTPEGAISQIIDSTGDGAGSPLVFASGVATDSSGDVFVSSQGPDDVFKIAPGGPITVVIDSSGGGVDALEGPTSVATDSFSNLFVAGLGSDNVFKVAAPPPAMTLRRGFARPTRNDPSKISVEGTIAGPVDVSHGVGLRVTDGASMDVATSVSAENCVSFSNGKIHCLVENPSVRVDFAPQHGSTDLRFKATLKGFVVNTPQAGPMTLTITLSGRDYVARNDNCVAHRRKLSCNGEKRTATNSASPRAETVPAARRDRGSPTEPRPNRLALSHGSRPLAKYGTGSKREG